MAVWHEYMCPFQVEADCTLSTKQFLPMLGMLSHVCIAWSVLIKFFAQLLVCMGLCKHSKEASGGAARSM